MKISKNKKMFDCWFESGSMPYASVGFPYKPGSTHFIFLDDFLLKGLIKQEDGLYTLLVISTALFDNVPFED
ncbi:MAG: class I tRNA ligase family protein, partial [Candidatus Fonsibacter sp.]